MRIRSIRPEFWTSEDVAAMDWHTRLIFIGLWSYVDDNGVGRDVHRLITAALFALDDDQSESSRRVAAGISALAEGGQIVRYSVDGKSYLYISAWAKNQRTDNAGKQRYPLPTCEDAVIHHPVKSEVPTLAASRRDSRLGEGEKGRRGEEEKDFSSEVADAPSRPDVDHILDHLDAAILANGARTPTRNRKNLDAARLLLDRDGRTVKQVEAAIDYATTDEFWRANILSMVKLREKYDQLRLHASRAKTQAGATKRTTDDRVADHLALARHLADGADEPTPAQIGA